jgi:hypothetical protein
MKRNKPLRRGRSPRRHARLRARKRIRPRNEERHARDWPRQFGSEERVQAIRRLPCIVPGCRRRSQNCHTFSRRTATWRDIYPGCWKHHREQHQIGVPAFMEKYHVDVFARAAQLAEEIPAEGPALAA